MQLQNIKEKDIAKVMHLEDINQYDIIKERVDADTVKITLIKKMQSCDICGSVKKRKDITIVAYPIFSKEMGRSKITKKVCSSCHPSVIEVLSNLKYN